MQVMHGGRVSHTDITGTDRIVAPSAIAIQGEAHTPNGKVPYPVPHALTTEEVRSTLADIVAASKRAVAAGLDGVEIHSANGYLLHEFLSPNTNSAPMSTAARRRTGPAPSSRSPPRSPTAIGAGKVGIRISPMHHVQGMHELDEADVRATYGYLLDQLARWAWPTCRCCTPSRPATWCRSCAPGSAVR